MKRGNINGWKNLEGCQNLLFFAQLVNELIFDYSIPSNRISTLNSHFLCFDALSAISDVDDHGVPEGTVKPIIEELYNSLEKDHAFDSLPTKPLDLFVKQEGSVYKRVFTTKDLSYEDSKKIVIALFQKYFSENEYCELLKQQIKKIIEENDAAKQDILMRLTKSFLTELVNQGYSQQYIYDQMIYSFFNKKTVVKKPQRISRFLEAFSNEEKEYEVFFIADKSYIDITGKYDMYSIKNHMVKKTSLEKEEAYLNKSDDECFYVTEKIVALDPYSAVEKVTEILKIQTAFYRLNNHNTVFDFEKVKWGAYDTDNYFTVYKQPVSSVKKARTVSNKNMEENITKANKATSLAMRADFLNGQALINAVTFHSLSVDSSSEENQLLDLWAIFETLLDVSQKHTSDRIQQVIKYLVPILKQKYLYSLFEQLTNDIRNYSESIFKSVVGGETDNPILAVAKFVILECNEESRTFELEKMVDFPLLKERIIYYNKIFQNNKDIYNFTLKHTERISWQIMRIYRNRNLIIHNANSMPYLPLLIENLHAYVDSFLDYYINGFIESNGKELLFQELFVKECEWVSKMNAKGKSLPVDENMIKYILS